MNKEDIKSLLSKGLIQIFSANFINKIVQFMTVLFLTNIISVNEYGAFSYAQNTMSFALLLEGLGVTAGILQYSSVEKDPKDKYMFFGFGIKIGFVFNIIVSIMIMGYAMWGPVAIQSSRQYLFIMAFIPILSITYSCIQSYLRASLRNKEFSRLTVFNTIMYFIGTVSLSYIMGANGLILGMYIAYLSTILLGIYFLRDDIKLFKFTKIDNRNIQMQFIKYSIITVLSNAMSQILYLLDTQLIGVFTKNEEILASYKVATTIPFNITFIPLSLLVFVYPYFAQNKENKEWIKEKLSLLIKGLAIVNLLISLGGIILAKPIFYILFPKYIDSVNCFRVLMVGYFISGTFRIPYGNVLASLGDAKANLINAVFSGIANIILDIVFIKQYGSIGAAYATLLVFIISSIIHHIFIKRYINRIG
ncbi:polysaccharide biosynthesis C-terminal domain-containing protein [Clostridium tertium]|uniref:oligosaccharide flippase family protein n=1 Tax=Clostridium tertium TaxID=1559 RepID=UPI0023307B19|nr:polysaccharide biosynthesis C-terminal domain-containing protein [Clostridium tertium]MDB1953655.1 polysaccharide biosynthesis C-terminal domain-containing protein [Clostridium tertium]MDB1957785.1 polysaccharide biosynthesis C-terminal domain-containing protein [Clostridium tertium]MDB1961184.1 polysaccharide biosynthesis C-terminal domain-containing protein [Clostridium tertium]MDB1964535.1 polysaccharide biosynthesis C-terminal domain-containing protein [Clostridium tertium]